MGVRQFAHVAGDRWASQLAVGRSEFLKSHHPSGRRQETIPPKNKAKSLTSLLFFVLSFFPLTKIIASKFKWL
jgi:hypothetical protein